MGNGRADAIAFRAYAIWQEEGCPEGQADRHWFQAESETSKTAAATVAVAGPRIRKRRVAKAA